MTDKKPAHRTEDAEASAGPTDAAGTGAAASSPNSAASTAAEASSDGATSTAAEASGDGATSTAADVATEATTDVATDGPAGADGSPSGTPDDTTKSAFEAAIARKKAAGQARSAHLDGGAKVGGATASHKTSRTFRRKSG